MQLEVAVTGGTVRGSESDGIARFLGIPYAAAPFGVHRFGVPAPVVPWEGVRETTSYGPTAPKPPYPPGIDVLLPEPSYPGEECLNLNVWTPGGEGLPVFVWIHGGAFVNGSGAVPEYDGTAFARDGVVTVTINYRLGIEGFLHIEDGEPANLGLRDQLAALEWVRDNIAGFGADPAKVTIGGESAGAMSVASLLSSPLAAGLFRAAVLQSGAGTFALAPKTAAAVTAMVAAKVGVEPTREALKTVPAADLLAAQVAVAQEAQLLPDPAVWGEIAQNRMAFEPVIDGTVLTGLPAEVIAAGAGADVPVLIGTNRDEHRLFFVPTGFMAFLDENFLAMTAAGLGLSEEALEVYRKSVPDFSAGELVAEVVSDWFFRIPALRLAEQRDGQTYVYEFQWATDAFEGKLGSCHALEIGFVFDTLHGSAPTSVAGTHPPASLAAEMHAVWVEFVKSGEPGWPAYSEKERMVRLFGGDAATETDPRGETRALWDGVR